MRRERAGRLEVQRRRRAAAYCGDACVRAYGLLGRGELRSEGKIEYVARRCPMKEGLLSAPYRTVALLAVVVALLAWPTLTGWAPVEA